MDNATVLYPENTPYCIEWHPHIQEAILYQLVRSPEIAGFKRAEWKRIGKYQTIEIALKAMEG